MWLLSHVRNLRLPPSERGGEAGREGGGPAVPGCQPARAPAAAGPLLAPVSVPPDLQGMMYETQIIPSLNNL